MSTLHGGIYEIGRLDQFARLDTPIHRIDARAKVLATFAFILCVVSYRPYQVAPLLPFALFPLMLAAVGRIPLGWLGSRLLAAAPFALLVGAFNPLLDRSVIATLGPLVITGGVASYVSIILRFLLTAAAAFVLVATTSFTGVCNALERLGVPDVFATQLLFLYRYLFVLAEETLRMMRARDLRSLRRRGTGIRVFGRIVGHLLLRTYARAQRIHSAMLLRGFDGHVRTRSALVWRSRDLGFIGVWALLFLAFRLVDLPLLLGTLITGALS